MFLGSGSVIHAMGGEQDMRKMGGLRKYMPTTYWTFLVGTLAISGVPFFAGFFSKDQILASVFGGHKLLWVVGMVTAGLTALYMFRLVFMTFWGEFRGSEERAGASARVAAGDDGAAGGVGGGGGGVGLGGLAAVGGLGLELDRSVLGAGGGEGG